MEKIQNKTSPLYIGPPIKAGPDDSDPDGLLANGISKKSNPISDIAYPLPVKKDDPISGDLSILPTNPVPSPIPGPKSREEKIILEHINYAKALAKGTDFFRAPAREQLYAALEKLTGEKITDEKKAAVDKFLDAVSHDKPADVDGTGPTGLNDITIVWKTGNFFPVGWDPVNDPGEDDGLPDKPSKPDHPICPDYPTRPPIEGSPGYPTPNKPVPDPTFGPMPNPIWNHPQDGSPNHDIKPFELPWEIPNQRPDSSSQEKKDKKSDYPIVY